MVGSETQPSVAAVGANLVVPELAAREMPSSAWPQPSARVLGRNLVHEGELVGRQITLSRTAGQRLVGSNFFQVALRHPFTKILLGPT